MINYPVLDWLFPPLLRTLIWIVSKGIRLPGELPLHLHLLLIAIQLHQPAGRLSCGSRMNNTTLVVMELAGGKNLISPGFRCTSSHSVSLLVCCCERIHVPTVQAMTKTMTTTSQRQTDISPQLRAFIGMFTPRPPILQPRDSAP